MMIQSKTNNHLSLIIWLGVLYNCRETFTDVMSALQIKLFMQNKPKFRKSQMNVNKVLTKDYEKRTLGERGKKQSQTNPNKAKFKKAKMNVTSYITKGYENMSNWAICENEPNSNPNKPNQTQSPAGSSAARKKSISCALPLVRKYTVSAVKSYPKIAENTLSVEKTSHKEENKIKTRLIKEFENVLEFI